MERTMNQIVKFLIFPFLIRDDSYTRGVGGGDDSVAVEQKAFACVYGEASGAGGWPWSRWFSRRSPDVRSAYPVSAWRL